MKIFRLFLTITLCLIASFIWAHDGEKHDPKKKKDSTQHIEEEKNTVDVSDSVDNGKAGKEANSGNHSHGVDEFPTLHPLVVHFPIMFLLIAAVIQLVSFFVFRRELSWVAMLLLILGFIGAYVAGKYVHPHTDGLTERALSILKEHDFYADWTVWLSAIGSILKIGSHFFLKRKVWSEAIVALVLIGAAYAVAMAGHHGAELVHKEGVGPQGKFLEMDHHH